MVWVRKNATTVMEKVKIQMEKAVPIAMGLAREIVFIALEEAMKDVVIVWIMVKNHVMIVSD